MPVNLLDSHSFDEGSGLCDIENETLEPCVSPRKENAQWEEI